MNYLETLKPQADKTIKPLSDRVSSLTKSIAAIRNRLADEQESADRTALDLAQLKDIADESLAKDRNGYERFRTSLHKLTEKLATSREIVTTLGSIATAKQGEIATARRQLGAALTGLYTQNRLICELRLAELLNAVLAEHDAFVTAFRQLCREHGASLSIGGACCEYPAAVNVRLNRVGGGMTKPPGLYFTAPPQAPQGPAMAENVTVEAPKPTIAPEPAQDTPQAKIVDSTAQDQAPDVTGANVVPDADEPGDVNADDAGPAALGDNPEGQPAK